MHTKETIKELLIRNDQAVARGIMAFFALQTADEQQAESTNKNNGVGFNGSDAPILSSFAKQLQNGRTMSDRQMELARKKIIKYAGQLTKIANKTL